jgi:bifunctional DNA-binding transcriptional regulator/antitoxin component of YhaV-PrlF toxin-antitoxin module
VTEKDVHVRIGENGRIVIPVKMRRILGVETGDEVILQPEENTVRITTRRQRIEEARRQIRRYIKPGTNAVDELIAERREAAKHE